MEPTLQEILDARERRVQTQRQLLQQYGKPLVCFTMNIPGPEKWNRDVSIGFYVGCQLLRNALGSVPVLHCQTNRAHTGCEAFYVVDMPARELKTIAMELEELDPIGRLFDMDVLDTDGKKLDREAMGMPRRKCLLCDRDAVICAGSRAHDLQQLQDRTGFLLYLTARQYLAELIAVHAFTALNQEVMTTPKPGLVDRHNNGSHPDMRIQHFFASANALRPYLCRFAEAGFLTRDLPAREAFPQLRPIGMAAEQAMYQATRQVNTHKGAIFSLGLLCAAAGRLSPENWTPEQLTAQAAAMTQGITTGDFAGITQDTAKTAGERLYVRYGITGVRGQAEAGFPAVIRTGLPVLRQALAQGHSLNDAGCITLLHLMSVIDDTNLIHRGGRDTQLKIRTALTQYLAHTPFPPRSVLEEMDRVFIQKGLSAGGSADLLSATLFLHFIC